MGKSITSEMNPVEKEKFYPLDKVCLYGFRKHLSFLKFFLQIKKKFFVKNFVYMVLRKSDMFT